MLAMIQQCNLALECSGNIFKIVKDLNLVLWPDTNWGFTDLRGGSAWTEGGKLNKTEARQTQFGTSRV